MTKSVMYIGSKTHRQDRVNPGYLTRVWNGTGAVVTGISEVQASNLCRHADEYVDVTDLDAEKLTERAAQAKQDVAEARRKALNHGSTPQGRIIEHASDEELMAELRRRRDAQLEGLNAPVRTRKDETSAIDPGLGQKQNTAQLADQVAQAIEQIATRGDAEDLDEGGIPKREAVQEILGIALTEDEYRDALGGGSSL